VTELIKKLVRDSRAKLSTSGKSLFIAGATERVIRCRGVPGTVGVYIFQRDAVQTIRFRIEAVIAEFKLNILIDQCANGKSDGESDNVDG
jgi:hypothetical protein